MKSRFVLLVLLSLSAIGCSSLISESRLEDKQNFSAYIGVDNVDYNSQYHFGYNIGCQSAITAKGDGGDIESMKDVTLDGIKQFDDGWSAGVTACHDGQFRSMYTVKP